MDELLVKEIRRNTVRVDLVAEKSSKSQEHEKEDSDEVQDEDSKSCSSCDLDKKKNNANLKKLFTNRKMLINLTNKA